MESSEHPDIGVLKYLPEEICFLAAPAMRFNFETINQVTEAEIQELNEIAQRMRKGNLFKLIDEFLDKYHMTKYEECVRLFKFFGLLDRLGIVYQNYLLSFATDQSGSMVSVHMDLNGADHLIEILTQLRSSMAENDCPHDHLFDYDGLTSTMLTCQESEKNTVGHVKIYGWNDEWAVKHKLRPH